MRKALKALHKACKADVKEHCSDIEAKNKKQKIKQTLLCLKEHKKELTETCTTKLKEAKKRFKNRKAKARVRKACGADIKKLCQDVKKDKDSIKSCLKANQEQVSQACKDLFQKEGKSKDDSSMVDTSLLQADDLVDTE